MRWIALVSVAVLSLSACGGEDSDPTDPPGSDDLAACSLLSDDQAAAAIDVDTVQAADESKDLGGAASHVLSCRWTGPSEGPALLVVARQAASEAKAAGQVAPATATCAGASELTLDGVTGYACPAADAGTGPTVRAAWDSIVVTASLTESRTGPKGSDAVQKLTTVVDELHDSLQSDRFGER